MPKYLWSGSYTTDGMKGLLAEGGTSRRTAVQKLAESLGGKVESMYFGFGSNDLYVTFDMPDSVSSAAMALTVGASGAVTGGVTVLLTPEEIDAATRKSPIYRPPGH